MTFRQYQSRIFKLLIFNKLDTVSHVITRSCLETVTLQDVAAKMLKEASNNDELPKAVLHAVFTKLAKHYEPKTAEYRKKSRAIAKQLDFTGKKIIGYQIESRDGKHRIPPEFASWHIFPKKLADKLITQYNNPDQWPDEWKVVTVYEGDIQDYEIIKNYHDKEKIRNAPQ